MRLMKFSEISESNFRCLKAWFYKKGEDVNKIVKKLLKPAFNILEAILFLRHV